MILVTGSAGFIGSNLCHILVKEFQAPVIGLDRLGSQSNRSWTLDIESGPNRMVFLKRDLTDMEQVEDVFKHYPIEQIVHLAAESHVDRSITNAGAFWKSNVIGTQNLMDCARRYGIDVIINQITDEAYGPRPDEGACEGEPFNPTTPYPCSKVAQYWVGRSYAITYDLPVISTFPVNCYGPRQNYEKLIPKFAIHLLRGDKVPLMQSTHFQRDWLPVEDMCYAHITLLEDGARGEDYNVGADNHCTNMVLTHKLIDLCERDESAIELVPDRAAHDCRYAVNTDKLKSIGWKVQNDFDEYLASTVEWYKEYCNAC